MLKIKLNDVKNTPDMMLRVQRQNKIFINQNRNYVNVITYLYKNLEGIS